VRLAEPHDDLIADQPHRPAWKRVLLISGGVVFLLLGVVGWLVPVMTGIPFYVVGLLMLGFGSRRCATWVNALDRRLPNRWRHLLRRHGHKHRRRSGPDDCDRA
jgi:uncharacterized membrane protein YbaN (DUF454 family)